jgi:hypothetical protein
MAARTTLRLTFPVSYTPLAAGPRSATPASNCTLWTYGCSRKSASSAKPSPAAPTVT